MRVESNVESLTYCVLCTVWLKSKFRNEIYMQFGFRKVYLDIVQLIHGL